MPTLMVFDALSSEKDIVHHVLPVDWLDGYGCDSIPAGTLVTNQRFQL